MESLLKYARTLVVNLTITYLILCF